MTDQLLDEGRAGVGDAPEGPLHFECPRCKRPAEAAYWGPCSACRDDLAATQRHEATDVGPGVYEPKMNVVPNQVATRD